MTTPKNLPWVSIVIPVKKINAYIHESMSHMKNLDYENFEILIFPDIDSGEQFEKAKIIPTGPMGPADKRDLAIEHAKGEILAFLDDDAYPRKDWLQNAVKHFEDPEIAAVGGPAVTPNNDNIWQQASGKIFETYMGGGHYAFRYTPKKKRYVDDFPSVNLLVRKSIFKELGGFDSHYWPGEDTKLCLDITKKLNKKIIYDPEVFVWHHRRELFKAHLKQIGNYAIHRGKFAKEFPETSLRLSYFVPTLFFLFLSLGGFISFFSYIKGYGFFLIAYTAILLLYFTLLCMDVARLKKPKLFPLIFSGIFITHIWYGMLFIFGLLRTKLKQ